MEFQTLGGDGDRAFGGLGNSWWLGLTLGLTFVFLGCSLVFGYFLASISVLFS